MKRFIVLFIITVLCMVGLLSARGIMPSLTALAPEVGPALDFLKTPAGLITGIAIPVVMVLLFFGGVIFRLGSLLIMAVFAPVIDEEKRINRTLTRQIEANEKKLDATEQALKEFTDAVAQYARHFSSHTSAVQGLSGASDEMNSGNAVQNRFIQDLIKNTEERLVSKEALLATLRSNIESPEQPAEPDLESVEPALKKSIPSYRALHPLPPRKEKPAPEDDKEVLGPANLVEAMVLPYYRAFDELDAEKSEPEIAEPSPEPEKSTVEAKKAVEAIMFPLYRTLYQAGAPGDTSIVEKPDEVAAPPPHRKSLKKFPPGCARRNYPLRPE